MRTLCFPALGACLVAAPVFAGTTCNFNVECYMTQPCEGSGWELAVDLDVGVLSSVAENYTVVHTDAAATQIAATGAGSLNLLTIGEEISFFTTHIGAEPVTITYIGECFAE